MSEDVSYVSVCHFTSDALNILNRLNTRRLFPSTGPGKLPRDWRGLANLIGITAQDAESRHENMVKWILETWVQNAGEAALVHQLLRHLETIDRYDIRDDLQDLANANRLVNTEQKWTIERQMVLHCPVQENDQLLTMDDVDQGAPVEYDALVLYAADDQDFVDVMISNMSEIGFKLFTKHSLRPGAIPYGPMTELISSRCRHTILVYSPAFFKSLDDRFYTEYVHARNIEKKHTLIPCVYRECTLPPQFRYIFALYVSSTAYNFWDRLARSVDAGRTPRLLPTNSVRIQEVTSGSQLRLNGSQLKITNGPVPNGQIPNGAPAIQVNGQPSQYVTQPSSHTQASIPSEGCVSQHTTTTIALPDVPSTSLSVSVTSLTSLDSRRTESASLNDLSTKKKKKSFLKKLLKFPKKKKEVLLTTN
ncbi:myeloid differentiation primary response protein MyD88-like [Cydia fagiglandana]|uniref:myeloid differentiation primary response protein MyD88-like n=1 Tax=Cydia fagiglandana TaxID=1458189 RepID=UPI002FEE29FE